MVTRIPITQARVNLGAVVKRVHLNGEYFLVEKDGIPVAGIMGADELEDYLELKNPEVRKSITASRKDELDGRVRPLGNFIAELANERKGKKKQASKRVI